ncbi:MAG: DUF4349 domain-containing protein, partial [Phycisphaerales bacterium]|nr:DUF4349 domain-containing protein [Phycisphaerales bacterium]
AFLKAQHVISPARSEYVEASSLSGEAERARGSLTLRVEASRLSDVLNALHELGVVHAEQASGEDVTDQVIDIEARLRNEQRIETELLELLDRRDNAPLEDVMALRDRIAMVRSTIERLVARRDGLDRLVSLATVLVIIAPNDDAPAPEPETTSIGDYFGAALASGWDRSLRTLADSLGGAMRFIIGGLLWWTIAVGALLVAHAALRRRVNAASSR